VAVVGGRVVAGAVQKWSDQPLTIHYQPPIATTTTRRYGVVPGVVLLAFKHITALGLDRGEEALSANALLGGDCCHRGSLLGALLGAAGVRFSAGHEQGLVGAGELEAQIEHFAHLAVAVGAAGAAAVALAARGEAVGLPPPGAAAEVRERELALRCPPRPSDAPADRATPA
jgi:hypothetical protein